MKKETIERFEHGLVSEDEMDEYDDFLELEKHNEDDFRLVDKGVPDE